MAHLTAPRGFVVEIDDAGSIEDMKQIGYRESTDSEIDDYKARKAGLFASANKDDPGQGVFFLTVSPGSDGYGMSRDILKTELFTLGINMQEHYSGQKVGLLYSYPNGVLQMQTDVRLIMTMFESDKIPEDWGDYLSQADEVIVPSSWCAKTFADAGIATTVIPLGYNDRIFKYVERPVPVEHDQPFTFIHYNSFNIRKGFFEVLRAFKEEFGPNEPVRLILKSSDPKPPVPIIKTEYPNVEVITENLSELALNELLARANCMVYPSMGEGFGITPLEAMATGMPAIVPNAHGISEYFNSNYMLEVKVKEMVPGLYAKFRGQDVGKMVVCDVDDLRKQMRYAYNHQAVMHGMGKAASEYVQRYTYKVTAERLDKLIRKWMATETIKRKDSKFLKLEAV